MGGASCQGDQPTDSATEIIRIPGDFPLGLSRRFIQETYMCVCVCVCVFYSLIAHLTVRLIIYN